MNFAIQVHVFEAKETTYFQNFTFINWRATFAYQKTFYYLIDNLNVFAFSGRVFTDFKQKSIESIEFDLIKLLACLG